MANFKLFSLVIFLSIPSFSALPDTIHFESVPFNKSMILVAEISDTADYTEGILNGYALEAKCNNTVALLNSAVWSVSGFSVDCQEQLFLQIKGPRPCVNETFSFVKKTDKKIDTVKFSINTTQDNSVIIINNLPCFLSKENPRDWQVEIDVEKGAMKLHSSGEHYLTTAMATLTLSDTLFVLGLIRDESRRKCFSVLRFDASDVMKRFQAIQLKSKVEKPADIDWVIKYNVKKCRLVRRAK